MIQDKRLGGKHIISAEFTLELIQLISRSRAFDFVILKTKIRHSRGDFSLLFQRNFDFKHSSDVEMSLEEEEIKRFND